MTTNNHRRYNPLLDEWVIVAANRVNRPWNGANAGTGHGFEKNEMNALAPGGKRRNGEITPNYLTTFVFDNDFPSFTHFDGEDNVSVDSDPLFCQQEIRGICRVICYHPDTNKTMATMNVEEIVNIIHVWIEQFNQLKHKYKWIQIFENRGSAVGCSNSHPHGQLWAGDFLPNLPKKKDKCQRGFYEKTGRPLLVEYLEKEIIKKERIILHNEYWTVLVPFWAFWPYETMILPNRHVKRMDELTEVEQMSLADILRRLIIKYDNIFQCTFPFSMGWLGAPTGDFLTMDNLHWQLHASFYPPLLRSATVPKYMAGYEVFAESQRDITPEMAASTIRNQSDILLKFEEFGSNVV